MPGDFLTEADFAGLSERGKHRAVGLRCWRGGGGGGGGGGGAGEGNEIPRCGVRFGCFGESALIDAERFKGALFAGLVGGGPRP